MASRVIEDGPNAGDDLDDIFGYDLNPDDARALELAATQAPQPANNGTSGTANASSGLNLDEEVKIIKRREPVAKLDEERLLGQTGIVKLRTLARTRLKLRGKGHEFDDVARLLGLYQLWMDDMYPRAKFSDGLAIIEKLGHSKRMGMLRRDWINEGKPRNEDDADEFAPVHDITLDSTENAAPGEQIEADPFAILYAGNNNDTAGSGANGTARDNDSDSEDDGNGLFIPDSTRQADAQGTDDVPMDDDLDALLAESAAAAPREQQPVVQPSNKDTGDDSPMDDDLDALLAESDTQKNASTTAQARKPSQEPAAYEEEYADDIEAMNGMW